MVRVIADHATKDQAPEVRTSGRITRLRGGRSSATISFPPVVADITKIPLRLAQRTIGKTVRHRGRGTTGMTVLPRDRETSGVKVPLPVQAGSVAPVHHRDPGIFGKTAHHPGTARHGMIAHSTNEEGSGETAQHPGTARHGMIAHSTNGVGSGETAHHPGTARHGMIARSTNGVGSGETAHHPGTARHGMIARSTNGVGSGETAHHPGKARHGVIARSTNVAGSAKTTLRRDPENSVRIASQAGVAITGSHIHSHRLGTCGSTSLRPGLQMFPRAAHQRTRGNPM